VEEREGGGRRERAGDRARETRREREREREESRGDGVVSAQAGK